MRKSKLLATTLALSLASALIVTPYTNIYAEEVKNDTQVSDVKETASEATAKPVSTDDLEDKPDIDDGSEDESESNDVVDSSIFELSRDTVTINAGKSYELSYDIYPEQAVSFVSESPKVAKIDENGKITGLKSGTATIVAIAEDGSTVECLVNIVVKPTKLTMNKKTLIMEADKQYELKAAVAPANVTKKYKTIKWSSSNKRVAKVDAHGVVTTLKKGSCTITATTLNGVKAKCKITVK